MFHVKKVEITHQGRNMLNLVFATEPGMVSKMLIYLQYSRICQKKNLNNNNYRSVCLASNLFLKNIIMK